MSYAIIRNEKYKMSSLPSIGRHNERKNEKYGNEDIDTTKSNQNYHLKEPQMRSYEKEFQRLKEENNLKGNLRLTGAKQSNVACEFLITSDNEFFKGLGEDRTKEFFRDAYEFACEKCGDKNVISAVVHMDERTPHMHLTYIPVVEGTNRKGESIEKVNCSLFWKGYNSYGILQDEFYKHCKEKGYDLDRGEVRAESREHLKVKEYKIKAKAEELKEKKLKLEKLENIDTKVSLNAEKGRLTYSTKEVNSIIEQNKALKLKVYNLENQLVSTKTDVSKAQNSLLNLQEENRELKILRVELVDLKTEKNVFENYLKSNVNARNVLKSYTDLVDTSYKFKSNLKDLKKNYILTSKEIGISIQNTSILVKELEKTNGYLLDLAKKEQDFKSCERTISNIKGQIDDLSLLNFKRKKVLEMQLNDNVEDYNRLKSDCRDKYNIDPKEITMKKSELQNKVEDLTNKHHEQKLITRNLEERKEKLLLSFKGLRICSKVSLPKELNELAERGFKRVKGSPSDERELMNLTQKDKEILMNTLPENIKGKAQDLWNEEKKTRLKVHAPSHSLGNDR